MDKYYEDITNRLERGIYIFGAGRDGKAFLDEQGDKINVICFLDNSVPREEKKMLCGIPVCNPIDVLDGGVDGYIIVASWKYHKEMQLQLEKAGLISEQDFHVWQGADHDLNLGHIIDFILYNKEKWRGINQKRSPRKILVETMNTHCGMLVFNSYYANILAERYDAEIVGNSCKFGLKKCFLQKTVFASFNAHDFLTMELSKQQNYEANQMFNKIWPNLKTKYDWLAISIDGINYGFEIYRIFVRSYSAQFDMDKYQEEMKMVLMESLKRIVYYNDYFSVNRVEVVLTNDGLYWEGILRVIAWKYQAKFYAVSWGRLRRFANNDAASVSRYGRNLKDIFDILPMEEQREGIEWAKQQLDRRFQGDTSEIKYMGNSSAYAEPRRERILSDNDKIKVVICPHSVLDDPYPYGKFMFADHEDWLEYLGRISEKTDYDWYIKYHPMAGRESTDLWDAIIKKYPRIRKLPLHCSPLQLRDEGMNFALTLWGTIGHEYPLLGIQVINGAQNPHDDFDFDWNAKTIDQYEDWLLHLETLQKDVDLQEIYKFYYVNYRLDPIMWNPNKDIFYPRRKIYTYDAPHPQYVNRAGVLVGYVEMYGDWLYRWFLDEEKERGSEILLKQCKEYINAVDGLCKNMES